MSSGRKLTEHSPAKLVFGRMTGMSVATNDFLALLLTPHAHLLLVPDSDAPSLPAALQQRLTDTCALGSGHGQQQLGAAEIGSILSPSSSAGWRNFSGRPRE
jgi:hypothetical protein